MDAERLDALARSLATGRRSRRAVIALLLGGLLAAAPRPDWDAAACCLNPGRRCSRGDSCCGGARCQGNRCRCPRDTKPCGRRCWEPCGANQRRNRVTCRCVGTLGTGDTCAGDGECASGQCGCRPPAVGDPCTCRLPTCRTGTGTDATCVATADCCEGLCFAGGGTSFCAFV